MTHSNDMQPKPPRMRLWLRILLGVSLALNLMVIGLAVGAALRFGGPDGMRPPPPERSIGALLFRELPGKVRRDLRKQMELSPADRRLREREDVAQIGRALREVPFDPDPVIALLDERSKAQTDWVIAVQDAWLDRVNGMSDAERAAYADRLEAVVSRRSHDHHDHHDKPWRRED